MLARAENCGVSSKNMHCVCSGHIFLQGLRKTTFARTICDQLLVLVPPTASFRCNRSTPGALRPILCTLGNTASGFRSNPIIFVARADISLNFGARHAHIGQLCACRVTDCKRCVQNPTTCATQTEVSGEIQSRQGQLGQACSRLPTAGPVGRQWAASSHSLTARPRQLSFTSLFQKGLR